MDSLVAWIEEHYDIDEAKSELRCKRCGMVVDWVTKHAVERHGDQIEVLASVYPDSLARW